MGYKIEFDKQSNITLYVDDDIEITPYSRNALTNTTVYRVALTKNKGDTNTDESSKD